MSNENARIYTLVIEAKEDVPFPPRVMVNGSYVDVYAMMAGDKSFYYSEMEELLGELCENKELPEEYESKVKDLLISSGYWGEDEDYE